MRDVCETYTVTAVMRRISAE